MTKSNLHLLVGMIRKSGLNRYQLTCLINDIDYTDNSQTKEWNRKLAQDWMDIIEQQKQIKKQQDESYEASA